MSGNNLLIYWTRGSDSILGPPGPERRKTARNLLIIRMKKIRIKEQEQKYSSMILIGCEGPWMNVNSRGHNPDTKWSQLFHEIKNPTGIKNPVGVPSSSNRYVKR